MLESPRMVDRDGLARRFLFLRLLRGSLAAGAILDLAVAAVLLWEPRLAARALRLRPAGDVFYLWLAAALLISLALLQALAARDVRRYGANVAVAIAGRLLLATALAFAAAARPEPAGLYGAAAAVLALSLSHALFWWPVRL